MRFLYLVIFCLSFNVLAKVGLGNLEIYVFKPVDTSDDRLGGSVRYNAFILEDNKYITLDNKIQVFQGSSLQCEICAPRKSSPFEMKLFEIHGKSLNENDKGKSLISTVGIDFRLAEAFSDGQSYTSLALASTKLTSGYLLKLKNGKVVIAGSLGAGGKFSAIVLSEQVLKQAGLYNDLENSKEDVPVNLELVVQTKLTLSVKDTLFLTHKFLLGMHIGNSGLRRQMHELSIKATPLRSISDSRILKSIAIGFEHRQERIHYRGKDVGSEYTGVGAGISF